MTDHFADAGKPMPDALRLARMIEHYNAGVWSQRIVEDYQQAADELRRLYFENEKLRTALAEQPAEQEPVAWQHRKPIEDSYGNTRGASDWLPGKGLEWWPHRALYAAPPARNQCKFPLCQNEDYQQALAEQIKQELYTGEPAEQEPVAAQHRFRHPQKGTPDWSVWQPCKVAQRPAWEIDSQGYEVEYRALYTAPQPKREPVEATPYNLKRIAWELERTALGDGFYGNALRVAKDIPGITPEDRSVLDRYATGTQTGTDHVHLQWLARRLENTDDSKNGVQT